MQENIMDYVRTNHKGYAIELGEKMSEVNVALNKLLNEVIEQTQQYQLAHNYEEALKSIKMQETISNMLSANENVINELIEKELREIPEPKKQKVVELDEYQVDENVAYTLNDDFRFKRPYKFQLNEHVEEVSTWKEMLVKTCEYLNQLNPKTFEAFASDKSMQWGETYNFSKKAKLLRAPVKINNSNVYIETSKDSIAVRQMIAKMLGKFEIDKESFKVFLRADYTDRRKERQN